MKHQIDIRIYYEDTDAGGIVYHTGYLRFAERGRTEFLRARGIEQAALVAAQGISFVVVDMHVAFKSPARLDDLVTVETDVVDIRRAQVTMRQTIRLFDRVLAELDVRIACLDRAGKAARLPDNVRTVFEEGK